MDEFVYLIVLFSYSPNDRGHPPRIVFFICLVDYVRHVLRLPFTSSAFRQIIQTVVFLHKRNLWLLSMGFPYWLPPLLGNARPAFFGCIFVKILSSFGQCRSHHQLFHPVPAACFFPIVAKCIWVTAEHWYSLIMPATVVYVFVVVLHASHLPLI
nr:MAG TPA: hypothetical protein [Caudoviricetes sp.]